MEIQTTKKTEPHSLRANFSWTLVGNVTYAATQWALLVAIAKLGSTEMVGQFSLSLAITAPVFMFTALNLRSVQATATQDDFVFSDYVLLRLSMTVLAMILIAAVLALTGYVGEFLAVCALITIAKAVEGVSDICYGLMQRHERMDRIAHSMILRGTLALVIATTLLAGTGSLTIAIGGLVFAWAAVLLFHDLRRTRELLPVGTQRPNLGAIVSRGCLNRLCGLAALALPLGLVMILVSLNTNIPIYFLESTIGHEAVGYYAAVAYLMVAATTIVNAFGQAATPQLAQRFARGERNDFVRLLARLAAFAVLLGAAGWTLARWIGSEILSLVYTSEYAAYTDLLVLLMIVMTATMLASVTGYGMTAMRRFKIQLPIVALVTVVTAVVSLALIPKLGVNGAAWALLAAALVQTLLGTAVLVAGLRHTGA